MIKNFKKIISRGWINFKRNSYLSVAATGVLALALVLFLGLLSLQFTTTQVVASLEDKVDISAYFKADAPEEQILAAQADLKTRPAVATVSYISRQQALADFKARHAQDALIQESLAQLDDNPLTASLNIKTKDASQYAAVAEWLQASKYKPLLDKISFFENKTVIDRISRLSQTLKNWGLGATLTLALIAVLVTFNTVRLTIFNQKQEIEIMRLVGASNWHIRGPYLVEGACYGLFAALIALVLFYPILYFVSDKVATFIESVDLLGYFGRGAPQIVLLTAALGMTLGMVSSAVAIRKHLKV